MSVIGQHCWFGARRLSHHELQEGLSATGWRLADSSNLAEVRPWAGAVLCAARLSGGGLFQRRRLVGVARQLRHHAGARTHVAVEPALIKTHSLFLSFLQGICF